MENFTVPTRETVSPENQQIFDSLSKAIGKVPNLYATLAHSEHALGTYLALQNSKTSLKAKEREVINLVVSEVNACQYCLSAHTVFAGMNGFTEAQILEIRSGAAAFDAKLDALAKLTKSIAENKGHADANLVESFFTAGYNKGNLVDVVVAVGDKIITNYLHAVTGVEVDWPAAAALTV